VQNASWGESGTSVGPSPLHLRACGVKGTAPPPLQYERLLLLLVSLIPVFIIYTLPLLLCLLPQQTTVRRSRKSSQAYFRTYGEIQPVSQLVKRTAAVMQEYTQRGGVRPFGISLLVGGLDECDGTPHLYQVDPSGTYFAWKATAIGRNHLNAKNFLEKRYTEDMELEDAIHTALLTLREGFEGEMNAHNIQVGVASQKDGKFKILTPEQIQDYLDEAN
jgi:20S proteasome alpha/beta subunit